MRSVSRRDDGRTLTVPRVSGIGDRIKEQARISAQLEDRQNKEKEAQLEIDDMIEALRRRIDEKAVKIRAIEEEKYNEKTVTITENYRDKYIVSRRVCVCPVSTARRLLLGPIVISSLFFIVSFSENRKRDRKNRYGLVRNSRRRSY